MPALMSSSQTGRTGGSAHQLEADVRRALLSSEGIEIASLAVRRMPNGVCLEGVIRVHGDDVDVCRAVREMNGVGEVVDHLTICWNCPEPTHQQIDELVF